MALISGKSYVSSDERGRNKNKAVNALLICSEFEKQLKNRDDYFDFVGDSHNISIQDVSIASIIRVSGEIYVPEEFDMIHLIDEYKDVVFSNMDYNDNEERDLLNTVFEKSKMRIPIYCELGSSCDYWLGIGKISHENLLVDYNRLEDYEGTEVTIIARLESRKYYKDKPIQIYDIYKDFLGLNRALRKQISTKNEQGFESISVKEDYLALELLAVYC